MAVFVESVGAFAVAEAFLPGIPLPPGPHQRRCRGPLPRPQQQLVATVVRRQARLVLLVSAGQPMPRLWRLELARASLPRRQMAALAGMSAAAAPEATEAMQLPPASLVRPMALLARPMQPQTLRHLARARPPHKPPSMPVRAPGLHWRRARRTHLLDKLSRHQLPRLSAGMRPLKRCPLSAAAASAYRASLQA